LEAPLIFTELQLPGAFLIELEKLTDERGFFARAWCKREFEEHGLNPSLAQANITRSRARGTLRGLHFQAPPAAEAKLVRCTRGAVYDVIVDLRSDSATFAQWTAAELTADNHMMLYVPEGFAHGFQTLVDDVEVFYQMSEFYAPDHQDGIRYDDPAFAIDWPLEVAVISERDRGWPDYSSRYRLSDRAERPLSHT
jgi:dTDP-4-dehydrorhamnose 3,5-epimerase